MKWLRVALDFSDIGNELTGFITAGSFLFW